MTNDLETALLTALSDYPVGFPADGHQLAEKLGISPALLFQKATQMSTLPPQYEAGIVIVTTGTPQYADRPDEFLVQLQPLNEVPH